MITVGALDARIVVDGEELDGSTIGPDLGDLIGRALSASPEELDLERARHRFEFVCRRITTPAEETEK